MFLLFYRFLLLSCYVQYFSNLFRLIYSSFFLHFFFQSYCPKDYVRTCSAIVLFAGLCLNMFGSRDVRRIMFEHVRQSLCSQDHVWTCSAVVMFAGLCLNMFGSRYVRSIMYERVLSFCFSSCSPRIPPTLAPATTACTSTWERSTFWRSERVSP